MYDSADELVEVLMYYLVVVVEGEIGCGKMI